MKLRITWLLLFILPLEFASAEGPSTLNTFRRAKHRLCGTDLSRAEKKEISNIPPQQVTTQLSIWTEKWTNHECFIGKMKENVDSLFRMSIPFHAGPPKEDASSSANFQNSAFDNLVHDVLASNQSWDQLLLTKTYRLNPKANSEFGRSTFDFFSSSGMASATHGLNDFSYLSEVDAELITKYLESLKTDNKDEVQFVPKTALQAESVAGVLTTHRFNSRYKTTFTNQNRRRAAAIFRIFLCDPMTPVIIPSDEDELKEIFRSLEISAQTGNAEETLTIEQKHGEDPVCQSCHFKLDPAAKTYKRSPVVLAKKLSPGALVFQRADGTRVNIPVSGLGQLGEAITKQPEYLDCQVQHFWNWIIGENVPLSDRRKGELAKAFDRMGRKPKNFSQYLISQPEFLNPEPFLSGPPTHASVKTIFKRCDTCHLQEGWIPTFGSYPFLSDNSGNLNWLNRISKALDLPHDGAKAIMPPKRADWTLTTEERSIIKSWILNGAQDENRATQIPGQDALQMLRGAP